MTMREILAAICIAGMAVTGLTGSLVFSDLLNDVKEILPGDKESYLLHFEHPFPWDFRFWRDVMREHRREFPKSNRARIFKIAYGLMSFFFLGLVFCIFGLR